MSKVKPTLHICTWLCKLRCLSGHCYRTDPEAKCRCCQRLNKLTAHELSRTDRSEKLTVGWWLDTPPTPTLRERTFAQRMERLLSQLSQPR